MLGAARPFQTNKGSDNLPKSGRCGAETNGKRRRGIIGKPTTELTVKSHFCRIVGTVNSLSNCHTNKTSVAG